MANFKVSDRVRKIAINPRSDWYQVVPIGTEGVITGVGDPRFDGREYTVDYGAAFCGDGHAAMGWQLAPLTDPKEEQDAWARDKVRDLVKPKPMDAEREPQQAPTFAPAATFNGMTLVCTAEGIWALKNGVWQRVKPIAP